jgi:hypothetical protein
MKFETRKSECWVENRTAVYTVYHFDCGTNPGWRAEFIHADAVEELGNHPSELAAQLACSVHHIGRVSVAPATKEIRRAG